MMLFLLLCKLLWDPIRKLFNRRNQFLPKTGNQQPRRERRGIKPSARINHEKAVLRTRLKNMI